jgi:hypothetical protein
MSIVRGVTRAVKTQILAWTPAEKYLKRPMTLKTKLKFILRGDFPRCAICGEDAICEPQKFIFSSSTRPPF